MLEIPIIIFIVLEKFSKCIYSSFSNMKKKPYGTFIKLMTLKVWTITVEMLI